MGGEAAVPFVKSSCHNPVCRLEVSVMNECVPFSCIWIVPVTLEVSQYADIVPGKGTPALWLFPGPLEIQYP